MLRDHFEVRTAFWAGDNLAFIELFLVQIEVGIAFRAKRHFYPPGVVSQRWPGHVIIFRISGIVVKFSKIEGLNATPPQLRENRIECLDGASDAHRALRCCPKSSTQ